METFTFAKRELSVPTEWNDLSARDLEHVADLAARSLPLQVFKIYFILYLLDWHVIGREDDGGFVISRWFRRFSLSSSELNTFAQTQSYILEQGERDKEWLVVSKLTRDPYPRIGRLHGPGDILERLTYEQFMMAQFYESQLAGDPNRLSYLLACLWHSGDRFSSDPKRIARDAGRIERLSFQRQQVMFWLWSGCKTFIQHKFPRIFQCSDGKASGNVYEEQLRVVDALSGGDMTKKQLVRDGYLYDALVSMDESLRRQEEREKTLH